jgi:hypothetical protein
MNRLGISGGSSAADWNGDSKSDIALEGNGIATQLRVARVSFSGGQMPEQRFPYEQSSWSNDVQEKRRWYDALERMSPPDVRALLAESKAGSHGSVPIGSERNITRGFVEEWLAWHDRQKTKREDFFRATTIFTNRWAAIAATMIAAAAVVSFLLTVWRHW